MIFVFKRQNGSTIILHPNDELQGYEFVESSIEFRFVRAGVAISDWTVPAEDYVSLLRPVVEGASVKTRGLHATNLSIETRGLPGVFTLLVWRRD